MGTLALGNHRTASIQAPKAYLSSLASWRHEGGSLAPKTLIQILVSKMSRSTKSHPGQPREEHRRDRWDQTPQTERADDPCPTIGSGPARAACATCLDTETRHHRKARVGHSCPARPRPSSS